MIAKIMPLFIIIKAYSYLCYAIFANSLADNETYSSSSEYSIWINPSNSSNFTILSDIKILFYVRYTSICKDFIIINLGYFLYFFICKLKAGTYLYVKHSNKNLTGPRFLKSMNIFSR